MRESAFRPEIVPETGSSAAQVVGQFGSANQIRVELTAYFRVGDDPTAAPMDARLSIS
jgi:hypothetical protein